MSLRNYLVRLRKALYSREFEYFQKFAFFAILYLVGFAAGQQSHAMDVYNKCNELITKNYESGNYTSCSGHLELLPIFNNTEAMQNYLQANTDINRR